MSWRDQLQSGRFRHAAFYVDDHSASGGRRLAMHIFPGQDLPYAEDLGRKGREFGVECYVLGDNYMQGRDALVAALEQAGPGNLIHPWLGSHKVSVDNYRLRESTREGGIAWFSIQFVETGELIHPSASNDTASAVTASADNALASVTQHFADTFTIAGLPDDLLSDTEKELATLLTEFEQHLGSVTSDIAAEFRAPYNMAALIFGHLSTITALYQQPRQAFQLLKSLFDKGDNNPQVPKTTPVRTQQADNYQAMHALIQRTAMIEACRLSSQTDYETRDDAITARDDLFNELDKQTETASDEVYQSLMSLRTTVADDMHTRGARLPELTTYLPGATLPALVIAHRLYADAERDGEIIHRNKIRHPGFVPGGQTLEVVNV